MLFKQSIKNITKPNLDTNIKEAKYWSCSTNCGGSWCPII